MAEKLQETALKKGKILFGFVVIALMTLYQNFNILYQGTKPPEILWAVLAVSALLLGKMWKDHGYRTLLLLYVIIVLRAYIGERDRFWWGEYTFFYGLLAYLLPNMRYRGFLESLENGLSRDVRGEIVAVSDQVEYQDGARVVPVRVRAEPDGSDGPEARHTSALAERLRLNEGEDTEAERIVYLNVSKRDGFPGPGARVKLCCCGRHIKRVESEA